MPNGWARIPEHAEANKRPQCGCDQKHLCTPFGAPDSQYSMTTALAHLFRPGTAWEPHRSLSLVSP